MTSQAQLEVQTDPTVQRFELEVGQWWPYVAPLMARYLGAASEAEAALSDVTESLKRKATSPLATQLANDLRALLPGWKYFTAAQRAVLRTAAAYVVEGGDREHDDRTHGLEDDDAVVAAAIRVLLRQPRR